jgi:hypothetical protein
MSLVVGCVLTYSTFSGKGERKKKEDRDQRSQFKMFRAGEGVGVLEGR